MAAIVKSKNKPSIVHPPRDPLEPAACTYGNVVHFEEEPTQHELDCAAFINPQMRARGPYSRTELFERMSDRSTPGYFEWHAWTKRLNEVLCDDYEFVGFTGCAGCAKTTNIMGWAVNWWLAEPSISSVILVSTTKPSLRLKSWSKIDRCYRLLPVPIGHYVPSEMQWRATPTDFEHVIIGRAVDEGSVTEIAANIKGHHTDRQLVLVEEAVGVKPAIWEAIFNLWFSAHLEFKVIVSDNLGSWITPVGKFFEPLHGVSSVCVEDDEWLIKPHQGRKPGIALHFDALRSPNIVEHQTVSQWLPTKEKNDAAIEKYGDEKSPLFWQNVRGFPPPEGVISTVFTESALHEGNVFGQPFHFAGPAVVVGGFDPNGSFDGDKAAIRFGRCGSTAEECQGVQLGPPLTVPLDAASKVPHTKQLAFGAIKLCREHGCPIENLAVDCSGNNSGVADRIQEEAGNPIRVEFQGTASKDRQVSPEDSTLCYDKYRDKVTEMWFTAAQFCSKGQVRGLDSATAKDLVQRCFYGGSTSQKIFLEPKSKTKKDGVSIGGYKQRIGHSPDDADALAVLLEAARKRGLALRKVGRTAERNHRWRDLVRNYEAIRENVDYRPEPLPQPDEVPTETPFDMTQDSPESLPESDWERRLFSVGTPVE